VFRERQGDGTPDTARPAGHHRHTRVTSSLLRETHLPISAPSLRRPPDWSATRTDVGTGRQAAPERRGEGSPVILTLAGLNLAVNHRRIRGSVRWASRRGRPATLQCRRSRASWLVRPLDLAHLATTGRVAPATPQLSAGSSHGARSPGIIRYFVPLGSPISGRTAGRRHPGRMAGAPRSVAFRAAPAW
jgi:hypothetical protein